MISKELLSKVLSLEIPKIGLIDDNDRLLYFVPNPDYEGFRLPKKINIHELAHIVIDWIECQDYWIARSHKNIYRLLQRTVEGDLEVYSIDTKNREDVPFMCGQWILENKDK